MEVDQERLRSANGRRLMRLAIWIPLGLVAAAIECSGAERTEASADTTGTVIAYGHILHTPFVFSEAEGDTLLLNGYPFLPLRSDEVLPPPRELSADERDRFELADQVQDDLYSEAEKVRRLLNDTGPELTPAIVQVYRDSPYVEDVRVEQGSILVKYSMLDDYVTQLFMPLDYKSSGPRPIEEIRDEVTSIFWRTVRSGGLFAFGSTYRHYVPRERVREVLDKLEAFARNQSSIDLSAEPTHVREVLEDFREGEQ